MCDGAPTEQHPAAVAALAAMPHLEKIADQELARTASDVTSAICQVLFPSLH